MNSLLAGGQYFALGAWLVINSVVTIADDTASSPSHSSAHKVEEIIVFGLRNSLGSALATKRYSDEIVDAVYAQDIHVLPDFSIADSLQRVSGVQISRDRGDGYKVAVRGLSQVATTLNGREIFTANDADGFGRGANIAGIPAEMVSAIHVFKTTSASQVEGGIGGTIDLRSYHPFDFDGHRVSGSIREIYSDLADDAAPHYTLLVSNRWSGAEVGDIGALINFSYQERPYREDKIDISSYFPREDIIPGETVFAPAGVSQYTNLGTQERTGINLILQWRPHSNLEIYSETFYSNSDIIEDTHQINIAVNDATQFVEGSQRLFPGSNDIERITWTDTNVSVLSFIRDTEDKTIQTALGGIWQVDNMTLKSDLSYTRSENSLVFTGPILATTAARFTQDLGASVPRNTFADTDLLNPDNVQFTNLLHIKRPFQERQTAFRLDAEWNTDHAYLTELKVGLRATKRHADNSPGQTADLGGELAGTMASDLPELIMPFPYQDFFPGSSGGIENFLGANLDLARDINAYRDAFGITSPLSTSVSPLSLWDIDEKTQALYVMADIAPASNIIGNLGLRVVRTDETAHGNRSLPAEGGTAPIEINHDYIDYLPSVNLRYDFGEGLYARVAASKTITRQRFSQLSPSLTLFQFVSTPELNSGTAGNPNLKPVRSDNFDIALEQYFSDSNAVHVTGFVKRVTGFITTVSRPETYDGVTYQVTRPDNTSDSQIQGVELGYQQFYDFLPGQWSGLGLQINYTYVDSESEGIISGKKVPLQDLSRHSVNLVGMFEKGSVSARLAYNWRSRYLSGVSSIVGIGSVPVYTDDYGWLDASVTYRFTDRISVALEGNNLLQTVRQSYFDERNRPRRSEVSDVQYSLAFTMRL